IFALLASTRDGPDGFGLEVNRANQIVLPVGNVQGVAVQRQSLGVVELRNSKWTIISSSPAGPDNGKLFPIQVSDNNSVMCAVGNEKPAASLVSQHLAREKESTVAGFA